MRLAEDVLGILDDLRNAEGPIRRARIIGRLWSAARQLPADERRELASILADRYAPKLADRLAQGRDIQSAQLLSMIRAVGAVDADEISEIMGQLQEPEGRRALLTEVAESLEDDLDGTDLSDLTEDPAARLEAMQEAAAELAGDLALVPPDADPAPAGDVPPQPPPAGTVEPEATEPPGPGEGGAPADPANGPVGISPSEPVEGAGPQPGAGAKETAYAGRTEIWEAAEDTHGAAVHETGAAVPPDAAMPAISGEELAAIESPIRRLRALSERVTVPPAPQSAAELALAFPDGWQRRRAVAALCRVMPADFPPEARLEVVAALLATLGRDRDRRWIRRSLQHAWSLPTADLGPEVPTARRTGAPDTSSR